MTEVETILRSFADVHILVIGDLMLDDYQKGYVDRISPEAPVPILRVAGRETTLGGAGNVAKNLRALGASVSVIGVVGEDRTGDEVIDALGDLGVNVDGVAREKHRVSTRKIRYVSLEHGQQVFRADEEDVRDLSYECQQRIIEHIGKKSGAASVIVGSDYLKGVLAAPVLQATFAAARMHGVTTIIAPKDTDSTKYAGADVLMPNLNEFSRLVGKRLDSDSVLALSAKSLTDQLGLKALLVTRGSSGMTLFEAQRDELRRVDIPTVARNVYDVTGAGDTALAAFAAGTASRAGFERAAHLANIAAGVVVGRRGTAVATPDDILGHLDSNLKVADLPSARV